MAFIQLFFEHEGIAITQAEIKAAHEGGGSGKDGRPQEIPKIIHQVYHNWKEPGNITMPEDWDKVRSTCLERNVGWEYRLWTDVSSREFIRDEYPWFLNTYNGYRFPVQRTDAVRYFLIRHFGGIYLDLDNGCLENLEALLYYPAWTTDGGRGALSNNILGGRPGHPFWTLLTESLIPYNYNYLFPYITISYASGQWFETAIWQNYHKALPKVNKGIGHDERLIRIMMDDRPGTEPWIYFTQERGGSWVNWDNMMFLWIGDHLVFLAVSIGVCAGGGVWGVRRFLGKWRGARRYKRLAGEEDLGLDVMRRNERL